MLAIKVRTLERHLLETTIPKEEAIPAPEKQLANIRNKVMKHQVHIYLALLFTLLIDGVASARPTYLGSFVSAHEEKGAKLEDLRKFRCSICHVSPGGGGALNPYGQRVLDVLSETQELNFAAIDFEDSDGDGTVNLGEVLNGSNPGDALSPEPPKDCEVPE